MAIKILLIVPLVNVTLFREGKKTKIVCKNVFQLTIHKLKILLYQLVERAKKIVHRYKLSVNQYQILVVQSIPPCILPIKYQEFKTRQPVQK